MRDEAIDSAKLYATSMASPPLVTYDTEPLAIEVRNLVLRAALLRADDEGGLADVDTRDAGDR